MADFIQKDCKSEGPLFSVLKKEPPPRTVVQTKAFKSFKEAVKEIAPLQIPFDGKKYSNQMQVMKRGHDFFRRKEWKEKIYACKTGRLK